MKKIVVNGSFDVLHLGHLRLLTYARSFPNSYVYVLIDGDQRIKQLKGQDRPVHNEYERSSMLAALRAVDRVDIFHSDHELEDYIKNYQPDLMIKGSDYKDKPIIGARYCKEIIFYDRLEQYSTSGTIQRIVNRR